jgi:hypothetical protein
MIDIVDELRALVANLEEHEIDYALCGGMAMGVHGFARTTIDIDLLILTESLNAVIAIAKDLGYTIRGKDLSFKNGAIEIRRISKIDPESGDLLPLDLLLVTPELEAIWDARVEAEWEDGLLSVVTRDGLIELKRLRNSGQDIADIEALTEGEHDAQH